MNKLWQVWYGSLAPEAVKDIIKVGDKFPIGNPGLGFDGSSKNQDTRSSEIRWVKDAGVEEVITYYAKEANKNAFGFHVDDLTDVQYTTYKSATRDKYDWHVDTFWANPSAYDRKLSIIIQLSDSDDYEGGDFELDPQYEQPDRNLLRTKGTVIVFPSFLMHRVTPVTKGVRKSLVSWMQGPKFR